MKITQIVPIILFLIGTMIFCGCGPGGSELKAESDTTWEESRGSATGWQDSDSNIYIYQSTWDSTGTKLIKLGGYTRSGDNYTLDSMQTYLVVYDGVSKDTISVETTHYDKGIYKNPPIDSLKRLERIRIQ